MSQSQMSLVQLQSVHHIAIICSNYEVSKKFYTEVLGCTIVKETYRAERDSYKLDLLCFFKSLMALKMDSLASATVSPAPYTPSTFSAKAE